MIEDAELLRRYTEEKSEDAFAELVRRRVDLVYSVALRQVGGDAHLAEDVTQKVFVDLARKAATLLGRPVLSGWLYRSAQYAASDVVRAERRRRVRELESQALEEASVNPSAAADWDKLRPILDEAMGQLSDDDRDAVSLRYFEGRAFADIGRALRLTEEAARKRVDRALDKMSAVLSRRGITSTTTALGLALAHQVSATAPAGLAASITQSVLTGTGTAAAGVLLFMSSAKTTGVVAAIAAVGLGVAIYQTGQARQRRAEVASLVEQYERTQAQLAATQERLASAETRARTAEADTEKLLAAIEAQARSAAKPDSIAPPDSAMPITRAMVEARYTRAKELARAGQAKEALAEFLWCYDEGMLQVSSYAGVRGSFLLSEIARLGKTYPPALAALRERRDRAEHLMSVDSSDTRPARDFASLNHSLDDTARTLAVLDQLPPGDRRRAGLATLDVYRLLAERGRYADAVEAHPYDRMVRLFETTTRPNAGVTMTAAMQEGRRRSAVASAAKDVEVLAGAGQLDQAKEFTRKVLAFDNSPETRAKLQEHATRAGHPELLAGIPSP